MIDNQIPILDATRNWVRGFNAFPLSMLSLLISQNLDAWRELTLTDENFSDDFLPIWGTLWAFDDSADIAWLDSEAGISAMSNCGFRIFYHNDFGYFFGIDGAGYDFYEEHWIPLYLARGLHWHSDSHSFQIYDSWGFSEIDNLIESNGYEFSPALSDNDKMQILLKMADNYDPDVGYNFHVLDSVLHSLFAHRLINN